MTETGTTSFRLRRHGDRATFAAIAPPAGFLSQLLLVRSGTAPRLEAAGAYAHAARLGVRRLPPGYRRALTT